MRNLFRPSRGIKLAIVLAMIHLTGNRPSENANLQDAMIRGRSEVSEREPSEAPFRFRMDRHRGHSF